MSQWLRAADMENIAGINNAVVAGLETSDKWTGNEDLATESSYITKSLCNLAIPDTNTLDDPHSLAGEEEPLTTIVHEPNHRPKKELFTPATRRRQPCPSSAPRTGRRSRSFSPSRSPHFKRSSKDRADHHDADRQGPARRNSRRRSLVRCKQKTRSRSPSSPTHRVSSTDPNRKKSEITAQSQQTTILDGSLSGKSRECERSVQREVISTMGKWCCGSSLKSIEVPDIHVKTASELEKLISRSARLVVFLMDEGKLSKGLVRLIPAIKSRQSDAGAGLGFNVAIGSLGNEGSPRFWSTRDWRGSDKPCVLFCADHQICDVLEFHTSSQPVADLNGCLNRFLVHQNKPARVQLAIKPVEAAEDGNECKPPDHVEDQQWDAESTRSGAKSKESNLKQALEVAELKAATEDFKAQSLDIKIGAGDVFSCVSSSQGLQIERFLCNLSKGRQQWMAETSLQKYFLTEEPAAESSADRLIRHKSSLVSKSGCKNSTFR